MPPPRVRVSDAELLSLARACFLEHGPGVSTTVIAERAGLSQAAIFKRFATKEELLVAALRPPEHPPFLPLLSAGPDPDAPLGPQLVEIGLAIARFLVETVPCMSTLHASGVSKEDLFKSYDVPPPLRTHAALTAWFGLAVRAGRVRDTPPGDLALAFMGTLHVRAFLQHVGAAGALTDWDAYVRHVVRTFLEGVEVPS